jgi:hypothetical protein
MMLIGSLACPLLFSSGASGASIFLTWNPSPSADTAGNILYYGAVKGQYTSSLNTGTSTSVTVSGLTPGQTYYFAVAAYNLSGLLGTLSNVVTNTVPLQILAQPISVSAAVGMILVLSVNVESETPVTYQWFLGGKAIEGATSAILILPQISEEVAGSYTVVASSASGSATSQPAVVTVMDTPALPVGSIKAVPPGVYSGLFYQTNGSGGALVAEATTGFLSSCTIGSSGAYSARVFIQGQSFPLSGTLGANAEISAIVYRTNSGLSNLSLTLCADAALGTTRLSGVVSNIDSADPWVALLTANLQANAFSPAADFPFISPAPPVPVASLPSAKQTCQINVASDGVALLVGQLGDGTTISQAAPIGVNGSFPVFQSLYNNAGLLAGWITLAGGAPVGNLTWFKPGVSPVQGFNDVISFGVGPGLSANRFQPIP